MKNLNDTLIQYHSVGSLSTKHLKKKTNLLPMLIKAPSYMCNMHDEYSWVTSYLCMNQYYCYSYLVMCDCRHANGNTPVFWPVGSAVTKARWAEERCTGSLLFANTSLKVNKVEAGTSGTSGTKGLAVTIIFQTSELHHYHYHHHHHHHHVSCHRPFLPGNSLEPTVIPTAQDSSFTLQCFP